MYYAVSVGMLGYTRIQSVVCYNSDTRTFDELTPAVARKLIEQGLVKGVLWKNNEDGGEFIPDKDGFNKENIMVRTAAAKYRPLLNDMPGQPINSMYNVVRVIHTDYRGTLYEIVSNRYDRIKVTEVQLRNINSLSPVAGVWITDNDVVLADCIKIEDRRAASNVKETGMDVEEPVGDVGVEAEAQEEEVEIGDTEEVTMDDIFKDAEPFPDKVETKEEHKRSSRKSKK